MPSLYRTLRLFFVLIFIHQLHHLHLLPVSVIGGATGSRLIRSCSCCCPSTDTPPTDQSTASIPIPITMEPLAASTTPFATMRDPQSYAAPSWTLFSSKSSSITDINNIDDDDFIPQTAEEFNQRFIHLQTLIEQRNWNPAASLVPFTFTFRDINITLYDPDTGPPPPRSSSPFVTTFLGIRR